MMRKYLVLIVLLAFYIRLYAAPVNISGTASGAEGKLIHLYGYADLLTMLEKEVASSRVSATAEFALQADVSSPGLYILSVDFHNCEIFLEPGENYNLKIAPLNYNSTAELNPFIESQALEYEITNSEKDDLNALISEFNVLYNDFVLKNFNTIYRDKDASLISSFQKKVKDEIHDTSNSYFNSYVKYKLAGLEQVTQFSGSPTLMRKYLYTQPVLYGNIEYMNFFSLYFQKYILAVSRPLKFIDYPSILDKAESYKNMMKALKADTNLKRDQLRELVLLDGLSEMYYEPGYRKESVLGLLKEISSKSLFPEHRIIAGDIITVLTRLSPGTPAPDFSLSDRNKKTVSLSDFKGKPVILSFWTTYCPDCISKLELLKKISDTYGDKVALVSISADKSFSKMNIFLQLKKNFTWTFLHIGDSIDLLKEYNVKSYPLFVLIDKNGMIYESQAPSPGEGLEAEIEKLSGR